MYYFQPSASSSPFPSSCSLPAELSEAPLADPELTAYTLVSDDDPHIHRLSVEIEKER